MIRFDPCRAAAIAAATIALAGGVAPVAHGAQPAVWKHRTVRMDYFGSTSLYTCDGLEDRVRQILAYWGARQDMTVRARGCMYGNSEPSRTAWVDADFYSLMPAADSPASGVVGAEWKSIELSSHRPHFMDDGDCELVAHMKDLTLNNFSVRDVNYRTSCVPGEVRIASYSVRAQALELALPAAQPAAEASAGD